MLKITHQKDGYQSQFLDMNVGFLIKIIFPKKVGRVSLI